MVLCDQETGPRAFLVERRGVHLDSCLLDGTRVAGMDPAEVQPKHTREGCARPDNTVFLPPFSCLRLTLTLTLTLILTTLTTGPNPNISF